MGVKFDLYYYISDPFFFLKKFVYQYMDLAIFAFFSLKFAPIMTQLVYDYEWVIFFLENGISVDSTLSNFEASSYQGNLKGESIVAAILGSHMKQTGTFLY